MIEEGKDLASKTEAKRSSIELTLIHVHILRRRKSFSHVLIEGMCESIINDTHPAVTVENREIARKLMRQLTEEEEEEERKQIMQAMGGPTAEDGGNGINGHWYICPNGHEYYIGECGMAYQISRCNECGEEIGGSRHNLLASNSVSTRMRA